DGRYTAHDLNDLKRNVRTLVHRATEGMVGRFRNLDRDRFSKEYVESLRIFYAVVAERGSNVLPTRKRFESALIRTVEDAGPSIISVGAQKYWYGRREQVRINSEAHIEALTGVTMLA